MRIGLGIAILVLGVSGFLYFLLSRLSGFSDSLQPVQGPGAATLQLQPGGYTVYWEPSGLLAGWPDLECTVRSPSGKTVPVSETWFNTRYSTGTRRGVSVLQFDAPEAGAYEFRSAYPQGKTGGAVNLAIGPSSLGDMIVTVLGCLVILGGSIALGVWTILSGVKPSK